MKMIITVPIRDSGDEPKMKMETGTGRIFDGIIGERNIRIVGRTKNVANFPRLLL